MKKNAGWGNLSYVFARGYPYNTTYSGGSPFPRPHPHHEIRSIRRKNLYYPIYILFEKVWNGNFARNLNLSDFKTLDNHRKRVQKRFIQDLAVLAYAHLNFEAQYNLQYLDIFSQNYRSISVLHEII